jgi:hypothetical protein
MIFLARNFAYTILLTILISPLIIAYTVEWGIIKLENYPTKFVAFYNLFCIIPCLIFYILFVNIILTGRIKKYLITASLAIIVFWVGAIIFSIIKGEFV